jgi:hypothetical protein
MGARDRPFQTDAAKLNARYLSAVDRAVAEEKAAGHAHAVLALEGEKNLIGDKQPLPELDTASAEPFAVCCFAGRVDAGS